MNFSQNHFAPQHFPPQMANPSLQHKEPVSSVGRVIRFGPTIYAFVCDYCMSQHQNIGSFLHHTESHFQRNEISYAMPSAMTPVCPTQNPPAEPMIPAGTSINSNDSMATPYPVQLQHSQIEPMNQEANYTDEVFEIIDLGYDFDGKYPNAENIDEISIDRIHSQRNKKPKQQRTSSKAKVKRSKPKIQRSKSNNLITSANENSSQKCPFCVRTFSSAPILERHVNTAHAKIFKKIVCLKKAYKCKICGEKFPNANHTLEDAHEHLKVHYSN